MNCLMAATQSAPLRPMTNRLLHVSSLVLGFLLAAGCQSKGPVPGEGTPSGGAAPTVGMAETTGAHPGAANPHAGMGDPNAMAGDPHAGLGIPPVGQGPKLSDEGILDVGAIALKVPDAWKLQPPSSSMRKAQMIAEGAKGPAELVVFYFGPQGAGAAKANVDRWVGQFTTADGAPVTNAELKDLEINGHAVTRVEVAGRYASNMAMQGQAEAPVDDQRLIAAIISTPGGPYYLKFLGPNATVTEHRGAFDAMLGSIVLSP
jgi:hypothetical protein